MGTRAKLWFAGLTAVALVVGACGSQDDTTTGAGVAEGQVGDTTPDDGSGGDGQETSNETVATTAGDSYESGDGSTAGGGTDFKSLEAVTISELSPAGDVVGTPDSYEAEFDAPNDGEIESAFAVDQWTFEAEAGQLLGIDVLDIDHDCSQDLDLNLVSPSGARGNASWVGNGGCYVHGPFLLDESGQYAIELAGGDGSTIAANTGTYRFVPTFLTEVDVAALTFDQPNDGEISEILGVDRWTFSGAAGDLLSIDVLDIDHSCSQDLTMVVEDPNGERVDWGWIGNGGCHAHGPIELALDGEHVLELHGGHGSTIADNTGKYRLVPSWLTQREESAASAGSSIDGSISQVFGSQRWTFEASAGSALVIDVDSIGGGCSQDLDMRIEDPFGEEVENLWVGNGGCQSHGPFELERDGQYVLEFAGGNGSTIAKKTGDYTFSFTVSG